MAGKKEPGAEWHQTPVLVRADIFSQALEQGIDISDVCNQALADLLGIDYRQQKLGSVPVPPPVIIAKDRSMPQSVTVAPATRKPHLPPVINADDPKAAGVIAQIKKMPMKRPVCETPVPETNLQEESPRVTPVKEPAVRQPKKTTQPAQKKAGKESGLRKFISTRIIREDTNGAIIGKNEFFQVYARWCRDQKISPVPEQRAVAVMLKNQFAFREKVADGRPCWVNVRIR